MEVTKDDIWFIKFATWLQMNDHAVINGKSKNDGMEWTLLMFDSWSRNQNVVKVPDEVLKKFVSPCTESVGCLFRPKSECVICKNWKYEIQIEEGRHDVRVPVVGK